MTTKYKAKLKKTFNKSHKALPFVQTAVLVLATMVPLGAQAAQLENRQLELSTAAASATGVDYTFTFDTATEDDIGSFVFEICSNDPFPDTSCTAPSGFDGSGATATSDLGTVDTVTTSGTNNNEFEVALTSAQTSVPSGTTINVTLSGLTNPDQDNTEYWARLYTYSDTGATTEVDDGGLAFSTGQTVEVTARVQETLSFCVYTNADCGSGGSLVDLGILNTATTETGESYFDVATNARNGVSIVYYSDATLTSDTFTIDAFSGGDGTLATSTTGTEQFGLRVSDVTTGGQNAVASAPFDTAAADEYAFLEADYDDIGESSGPIESTTFTIEYAANVAPLTETGVYSTDVEYIATAQF